MQKNLKKYFLIYDFFKGIPERLWPFLNNAEVIRHLNVNPKTLKKYEALIKEEIRNGN